MKYNYTTCHPDKSDVIKYDKVLSAAAILQLFNEYPWNDELSLLSRMKDAEIQYSPSIEIIEHSKQSGTLILSAVGQPLDYKFLIFYESSEAYAQSGEVDNIEALQLLQLFLSDRKEELIKEIHLTQDELIRQGERDATPKWLIIIINLIVIGLFGAFAILALQTGDWKIATFFGSIMFLFIIVFIFYNKKT